MLCEMSFIPFSSCTIIFKFLFSSSTEHQAALHGPLPGNCQTFSVSIGHHTHATSCTLSLPSQLAIARAVNYLAVACLLAIESLYYTSFIKNHHQHYCFSSSDRADADADSTAFSSTPASRALLQERRGDRTPMVMTRQCCWRRTSPSGCGYITVVFCRTGRPR